MPFDRGMYLFINLPSHPIFGQMEKLSDEPALVIESCPKDHLLILFFSSKVDRGVGLNGHPVNISSWLQLCLFIENFRGLLLCSVSCSFSN